jgi:hypothetical protein
MGFKSHPYGRIQRAARRRFLRAELPRILAAPCDDLSPSMLRAIEDRADDWRRLDERIEDLSSEIEEKMIAA